MGFYGDWTAAPMIDEPYPYDMMSAFYGVSYILKGGSILMEMNSGMFSSFVPPSYDVNNYLLGMYTGYGDVLYGRYDYITFSPFGENVI